MTSKINIYDFEPKQPAIIDEILLGLKQEPKHLAAKFTYDTRGAILYEQICQTEDYYLTRTELAIMFQYIEQIAAYFHDEILLIEYGSGNSQKTRLLFDHLPHLRGYVPIDISKQQLIETATQIAHDYPQLEVLPVCADYMQSFDFPTPSKKFSRRLIYYPGSTIGNQQPHEAVLFLKQIRQHCQPGDALLIGFDLEKEPTLLKLAYDDRTGITAQFNFNLLERLNREFAADFIISQYQHYVLYNEAQARVELYIKSLVNQTVHLNGETIHFSEGELIERAFAYKYSPTLFQKVTIQAGWQTEQIWTDSQQWFRVQYLVAV